MFDMSELLNRGVSKVLANVIAGIQRGGQFGQRFAPNALSTVKKKGFNKPLVDKGSWIKRSNFTIKKATKQNQAATLILPEGTEDYASYNHSGTDKIPARPWWGVSKEVETEINQDANKYINEVVDEELIKMGFTIS